MKKLFLLATFAGFVYFSEAQQLKTPVASPRQELKQEFGLSTVEVSYSRPAKKGRTIFGELEAYDKVWRTGANAATTITFGDAVTFGNTNVPAGKYGLLTIPGKTEWTVILSKQTNVTSHAAYKQSEDVARVKVPVNELPFSLESFTISFDAVLPTSMQLIIGWDKTVVIVPITTEVASKVYRQISELEGKTDFPYFQAASFYLENNKELPKALTWFQKAAAESPDAYWVLFQKAQCEAKLGKKKEAIASAKKSKELAAAAQNDGYVVQLDGFLSTLN